MKNFYLMMCVVLGLTACQTFSQPENANAPLSQSTQNTFSGNLIVFYDKNIGSTALENAITQSGATVLYRYANLNAIALKPSQSKFQNLEQAIEFYQNIQGVIGVKRDEIQHLH